MERWQESLSGFIPPLVGHGVPAQRLSFYRNVFGCFMLR
nr:MAG TPA: Threonine synthase [Bacteriophage sp.]